MRFWILILPALLLLGGCAPGTYVIPPISAFGTPRGGGISIGGAPGYGMPGPGYGYGQQAVIVQQRIYAPPPPPPPLYYGYGHSIYGGPSVYGPSRPIYGPPPVYPRPPQVCHPRMVPGPYGRPMWLSC